ncbi:MAG TPA: glycosyltransferase family 1 protein [Casimicrobiaceae bacterium]|nr:glycosyltransferase family 1 protein [Casimicrobiaceae bacterium]
MQRLRILTWQVHGNYLYYLTHAPHDFYVLSKPDHPPGYGGRAGRLPFGGNVHDCPVETVRAQRFDCILFQSRGHYERDQHEILSEAQRRLPRIYLEHDPPLSHPTNTAHPVDDPSILIVHVTHYNALMWDCGHVPTRVVEHGVRVPHGVEWSGDVPRGVAVINHLAKRGRRLGADVFDAWRASVPIDLYGMDARASGGAGELPYAELMPTIARHRFFAHPVRYTSLALAVCEAMMLGLPVVGLATTELPRVILESGGGFVDSELARLVDVSHELIRDRGRAAELGRRARAYARERFAIERFAADWNDVFMEVA